LLSSSTGSIAQVLMNQPNITLDNDQNVSIRGNKNVLLLVDGVPTTVGSLQNIPASLVESIEIITNPDLRYDAEGTGGIIHLTTRKATGNGLNGALTLNMSNGGRVNGGLNLRKPGKRLNFSFGYNGSYEEDDIRSSLERVVTAVSTRFDQTIETARVQRLHTFSLGTIYKTGKKSQLSADVRLSLPELNNRQTITGFVQRDSTTEPLTKRFNDFVYARTAFEAKMSFSAPFSTGRSGMKADAGFSRTRGRRPANYYYNQQLQQKGLGGGYPTNATLQADTWHLLGDDGRLETGLKYFSRWNSFSYSFYDRDTLSQSEAWILNPLYSNDLTHSEHIASAYAMYSDTLVRSIFYKVGFRLEYNSGKLIQNTLHDTINKHYFFPFPFVLVNYAFNSSNQISIALNRRITRPGYPQLNPFINFIDEITFETGNKNLNPEILDKLEINYALNKKRVQFKPISILNSSLIISPKFHSCHRPIN
ncbi:MAG: outer membrane beta-barrel protein, partial [Bacteroidales bacterium]|nr:outer membrane beta-barrel protein [Bacteroidales bacterium]